MTSHLAVVIGYLHAAVSHCESIMQMPLPLHIEADLLIKVLK